jgi:RNA-binding protein
VKQAEARAARNRPLPLPLSRAQKRFLVGKGHELEPVIRVGVKGVTPALVDETRHALEAHELIKVKLGKHAPEETAASAEDLAKRTGAEIVHVIGGVTLLFKRSEDPAKRKLELPRL